MHDAPSVSYPVGRSSLAGTILLSIWMAGGLAGAGMGWSGASAPRLAAVAAVWLATGALAMWWWHAHPAGLLAWDAGTWSWSEGGPRVEAGTLHVGADFQSALLLRWVGEGATRWLWVERGRLPTHWVALRRAVYSRANPQAPSRAEPPSATP
jgi:toxin CptA